jgi:DMSO reductase family type II enzyme chaperone
MGTSGESAIVGSGAEERRAAARSSIYGLFQDALTYPDDEVREGLATGELVELMRKGLALAEVDFTPAQEWWRTLQEVGGTEDLAVEYTRLFDAGASGPPCPLYGGLYGGDRMKKMEEAVRFYNHFGLTTSEEQRELPDHLATQLEFMHYLTYREAEAVHAGSDAGPYRRAQRDFVARDLGGWIPKLCERLEEHQANDFFLSLFKLLADFLAWEGRQLKAY